MRASARSAAGDCPRRGGRGPPEPPFPPTFIKSSWKVRQSSLDPLAEEPWSPQGRRGVAQPERQGATEAKRSGHEADLSSGRLALGVRSVLRHACVQKGPVEPSCNYRILSCLIAPHSSNNTHVYMASAGYRRQVARVGILPQQLLQFTSNECALLISRHCLELPSATAPPYKHG
jgi:hypothetical protein